MTVDTSAQTYLRVAVLSAVLNFVASSIELGHKVMLMDRWDPH
ncbi:hypothetical protein O1W68_08755 [Rhodococcus sp. H36-A4]|nr:hypothetical protein [Rhodococcus sp. H36-A4]MCZ4078025.1 hypothetical protein [Rhodococcus sp. H36-A4]